MFNRRRRVEKQIQWVRDNYPVVATWNDRRVERHIRDASDDTKTIRFIVAVVGSVAVGLLGLPLHRQLAEFGLSTQQSSAAVTLLVFVAGALISGLLSIIWRGKLERLANGA